MQTIEAPRSLLVVGILASSAASGLVLARGGRLSEALLVALVFALFAAVVVETPIVGFFALAAILGLAPEVGRDDRLLGITSQVYEPVFSGLTLPLILLGLLTVVLAFSVDRGDRWWPGAPVTVVVILILIGLANVAWFSPLLEGLLVLRPLIVLLLATLVAYWTSLRYGTQAPLLALVVAGMLAIPGGFYNSAAGDLSYYDASFVYLIGMAAILVFFRVVDVGLLRIPFMLLALVVIVFSTRRGATLVVAIAFLITALVVSRGRVRAVTAAALAAVVVVELVAPDLVLSRAEDLAGYFAGTSGERAVDARNWESANAWENIRRNWAFGIGPTAHWALYDTVGGNFRLSEEFRSYLHNSYQWVWLRFGLIGLLAYVAFFLVSARTLLRRQAPRVAIIVGGSVVGAAVGVVTASFLTTTTRWPLTVGLLLGVALAALHAERSPRLAG